MIAVYVVAALELPDGDRGRLEWLTRALWVLVGQVTRAWIVLLVYAEVARY
ncbi:hypothetical protein [Mycobacterium leprae]|uniref:hypothetical protein n=1 Tax=Mycobacterium leprae TaxID=1769 RepID=UPI0003187489|nr:hypothetical protein [Mycobacterium leprae]